ncbi:MAG TPA: condensation domain-containing protein, partial [Candidatus Kapabacteria bacterium]|nr:condensation domain-containing protein [Candidatus Kapabacteria bacterium]
IEKKLVKLWSEILGKDEPHPLPLQNTIGIDANFFHMGGHSLKAMVLALRIQKEFKVRVQLSEIFKTPTIRQLSDLVAGRKEKESFGLEVIEKKEFYELSYNQKRLWVIRALELSSSSFNMPGRIELKHPVVEEMLRNTISKLVQRHESLRTGFKLVNGEPVQYIKKDVGIPFETVDISSLNAEKKQIVREQLYAEEKKFLFDLKQAPLIRFRLIKISSDHYDLIFNMHHIISDGWSIEILQKEFSLYYEACRNGKEYKPESLTFQYKDYAARQNKHLLDPCKQEQSRQYWQEKLMGDVESFTLFKLPVNPKGNPDDYTGAGYCCLLDGETKEKLEQLARHTGSTLFMVMFSAYLLLLSRLTNREDVICSIISAGRDEPGVRDIVGFFVNSILFSIKVDMEEPFGDFIRRVHTEIVEVFQHQYYSIETIFKELKMKYPDVPASFNMLNTIEEPAAEGIENFKPGHTENVQDVKFDLEVYAAQYKNGILLNWVYKKSLFDPATIEYIGNLYMESLDFFKDHAHENFITYKNKGNKNKGKKVGFKRN